MTPEGRKVVVSSDGTVKRFDLRADPGELDPITEAWPDVEGDLQSWRDEQARRAAAYDRHHGTAGPATIDAGQADRLHALGYIE